ncbi:MAG: HAD family hydrolase [Deltaproteobacteria bacterium]|nr:HAD family hydrolase [Deltaproteobacteria bacterium]
MPTTAYADIHGIVFDLDGTLYVNDAFASLIQDAAANYIAGLRAISPAEARQLIDGTRRRLSEESGTIQTLSAVCTELGGSVRELHVIFAEKLRPEAWLVRDERVVHLLAKLSEKYPLYIYTNNNRALATRIVSYLGLSDFFRRIFAIDDNWLPKPDEQMLTRILSEIGLAPAEVLFVGDRYDVDLRVPEQFGCPVYLSQSVEQLLRLEELLNSATPSESK